MELCVCPPLISPLFCCPCFPASLFPSLLVPLHFFPEVMFFQRSCLCLSSCPPPNPPPPLFFSSPPPLQYLNGRSRQPRSPLCKASPIQYNTMCLSSRTVENPCLPPLITSVFVYTLEEKVVSVFKAKVQRMFLKCLCARKKIDTDRDLCLKAFVVK